MRGAVYVTVLGLVLVGCGGGSEALSTTQSEDSCLSGEAGVIEGDVDVQTQADLDALQGVREVTGKLSIGGTEFGARESVLETELESLTSLDCLASVGEGLAIGYNSELTNLSGLENLTAVRGILSVYQNEALTSVAGLKNVTSVGGLTVSYNPNLTSLSGLDGITSVEDRLSIHWNASLTSLAGLENVTTVGGDLNVNDNAALTELTGLGSLASVGGHVWIGNNEMLASLAGLASLSSVEGDLYIQENPQLSRCLAAELADGLGKTCAPYGPSGSGTCTDVCTCTGNMNDVECP